MSGRSLIEGISQKGEYAYPAVNQLTQIEQSYVFTQHIFVRAWFQIITIYALCDPGHLIVLRALYRCTF